MSRLVSLPHQLHMGVFNPPDTKWNYKVLSEIVALDNSLEVIIIPFICVQHFLGYEWWNFLKRWVDQINGGC